MTTKLLIYYNSNPYSKKSFNKKNFCWALRSILMGRPSSIDSGILGLTDKTNGWHRYYDQAEEILV